MTLRLVFAGTPEFASKILEQLINVQQSTQHKILAAYTQPDRPAGRGRHLTPCPVKMLSIQHQIPVFQPENFKQEEDVAKLKDLKADLLIVAAYGILLPKSVLSAFKFGCINVHVSLLPRWRGAAPVQHALLAGDNQTGITIMQMDEGLDTGDILGAYPCTIEAKETTESLYKKLEHIAGAALLDTLEKLEQGSLNPLKQDSEKATYAHKIKKEDAKIHWKENTAIEIDRQIRAFNPWPISHTRYQGMSIRIFQAEPLATTTHALPGSTPGSILFVSNDGIDVATAVGILRIQAIQFEGKKKLLVKEILHSKPDLFKIGASFE